MKRFILKHRFLITVLVGIFAGLLTLAICNGQEQRDFSRYGLHDYKSGLQKVFNICKADPNITVVAYYKMGGAGPGIPDLSGNGLHLTASGTPTYRQPDYLGLNRAILFNPVNLDYFYHIDAAPLNLGTDDFIIWVIFKTTDASGNAISLFHKKIAAAEGYTLYKHPTTNKLEISIRDNAAHQITVTSNAVVNDGTWYLAKIVADRSVNCTMFLNGMAQADVESMATIGDISNTSQFCIGRNSAAANQYFNGIIPEFLMVKATSGTLPDWVMSPEFALLAYKLSMGWPMSLPREMQ